MMTLNDKKSNSLPALGCSTIPDVEAYTGRTSGWSTIKPFFKRSTTAKSLGYNNINIYLNDQGREVVRTSEPRYWPPLVDSAVVLIPVCRWFRFRNGWLFVLQGLEELILCRMRS